MNTVSRYMKLTVSCLLSINSIHQVKAQTHYPQLQNVKSPKPAPLPPGEEFTPSMSGSQGSNTPVCAEWTRTAGSDESLVITGRQFSIYSGINEGKDARFITFGNKNIRDAIIQRLDSNKAIITLSKEIAAWDMYLVWPGNENGYGYPIPINKTDAWWVGPDKAARGKTISVFGRNLAHNNDTLSSFVYIKPVIGSGQWATVTDVNPYKVDFTVPSDLINGEYEIWTHNGHGGEYGWSGPLQLTINNSQQWINTIFNVKNYGAKGNGITDDTQAIIQANQAAGQYPGASVYFPTGEYMVSNTIYIKSNIRYKGDGPYSIIKCASNFSSEAWGMLYAQYVTNFELRDLTIDGNHNFKGKLSNPVYFRASDNIQINNVRFTFQDYGVLDLANSSYVYINNCELNGKQSFLGNCSQLFIDRCNFKLTNDAEMALHSWGGVGVSVTSSTCQDFDKSNPNNGNGWGMGRFFVGNGNWGSNRFTYLGNNTTKDLTVRPVGVDQNVGEQFMWEGNFTRWSGHCASSTSNTTTLSDFSLTGGDTRIAAIVKGKGLGQSRVITGYIGATITLETPWNIPPDKESVINIGNYIDRIVVYNNYLDAKSYAAKNSEHNASSGIQPFGGCFNLIADGNTLHELRQGISNWVIRSPGDKGLEPNFFNLYTNNKIINCKIGIYNADGNWNSILKVTEGTGMLGTMYRKNIIENPIESGIKNSISSVDYPVLDAIVYEHNTITNLSAGFESDTSGIANQLFYKNNFNSGTSGPFGFAIQSTSKLSTRENKIKGFSNPYSGILEGPVIEAPFHVIEITANSSGSIVESKFTLWNSGTSAMQWNATSNAAWLSIATNSGTINSERDSSIIALSANPSNVSPGTYSADLTITCGLKKKIYQVILNVLPKKLGETSGGLTYKFYKGTFDLLPNFNNLTPVQTGTTPNIDISVRPTNSDDQFAFTWEGYISIPVAGNYIFETISDDGSKLYFNTLYNPAAVPTVNNDGLHAARPVTGSINDLSIGSYPISITFFEKDGGETMEVYWTRPDKVRERIPNSAFSSGDAPPPPPSMGLTYKFYKGTFDFLPNFNNLTPVQTGTTPNIDISVRPTNNDDQFAFAWEGYINIPVAGNYIFETISDDGSKLYFNTLYNPTAVPAVNNDGLHAARSVKGSVMNLSSGSYPISITFFEKGGGETMEVYWTRPDNVRERIPNSAFGSGNVPPPPPSTGLTYKFYKGTFDVLPNFNHLTPVQTGTTPNVDISVRPVNSDDQFAFTWEGYINIPVAGNYTFETISDDGSKLYFNTLYNPAAAPTVNNDGLHPARSASGTVNNVAVGSYPISITFFEKNGGETMEVYWTKPDRVRERIPNSAFTKSSMPSQAVSSIALPKTNYRVTSSNDQVINKIEITNIYPNPFTGNFFVNFYNASTAKDVHVNIYDLEGSLIHTHLAANTSMGINTININLTGKKLPWGVYMVGIIINGKASKLVRLVARER